MGFILANFISGNLWLRTLVKIVVARKLSTINNDNDSLFPDYSLSAEILHKFKTYL